MLSKRSKPMMIGKISELLLSGGSRGGFMEAAAATSPRSPLEMNFQSPRGMKSYDVSGGVGLRIVAALGKSSNNNNSNGCEVLEKYAVSYSRSSSARSNPIPVGDVGRKKLEQSSCDDEFEMDSLEDYTFVTCRQHGPNKQSFTRVYCAKGEIFGKEIETRSKKPSIFSISPGRCREGFSEIPREDFLSSCNLCKKKLHGKDVYMYRGEMAFCSEECRLKQIIIDEGKELWRPEASRSSEDVSSSTCTRDYIFSPSILAI